MSITQERFKYLFDQYIHNNSSAEELEEFLTALNKSVNSAALKQELETLWKERDESFIPAKEFIENKMLSNILAQPQVKIRRSPGLNISFIRTIAASLLLMVFAGLSGYYFFMKDDDAAKTIQAVVDVQPGKEGAILTLANGKTIILDDLKDGVVTRQKGASIALNQKKLIYDVTDIGDSEEISYNQIQTRRGRQFSMVLSDGTKVWLNSASTLKYPIAFKGTERNVEITGEAYFEVTRNTKMPFRVKINGGSTVEVLGTSFNVSAYEDERFSNTTLIEGKVKVLNSADASPFKPVVLKPGQQAKIAKSGINLSAGQRNVQVLDVDLEQVIAWKNGLFNFKEKKLKAVMNELSRWYDIEVVYEDNVTEMEFWGEISRNLKLSEVLHLLKKSGVNFKINKERKLIVLN